LTQNGFSRLKGLSSAVLVSTEFIALVGAAIKNGIWLG
jgi:hypothetical protein